MSYVIVVVVVPRCSNTEITMSTYWIGAVVIKPRPPLSGIILHLVL